jgi:predicted NACHT family NTPase
MTQEVVQIKVFISCPTDVSHEKQIVRSVCDSISQVYGKTRNIQVKPIDWENDIIPEITAEGAQSVIDTQLNDFDYDIYMGILWSRFGDKLDNGRTPTEWEFECALNRMQATGSPKIQFYFKTEEFYPHNFYEANQLRDVIKFKERLKPTGYYKEFKQKEVFQNEVSKFILKYVENYKVTVRDSLTVAAIKFEKIPNYLNRIVISNKDHDPKEHYFLAETQPIDTIDLVKKQNRIVLLGNAGTGKTVELKRIAAHFSKENTPLYPQLIFLNKYTDQSIEQFLQADWEKLPESQLLIILDGLDEVESKNKRDIIRKIELFSEQQPSSTIIVSCRTNFYQSDTEQTTGTLKGFDVYILQDLDYPEIERYIQQRLAAKITRFSDEIIKNLLQPLLKIPFYLVKLVDLFEGNNSLPNSKALIFEQLLISRIKFDENHFRTTIELKEYRDKILRVLEHIALGMETLGRNYISYDELIRLIPQLTLRDLIKHCTAWKTEDGGDTWQFEHNNIQEYLAANVLARQPVEKIKSFISFRPEHKKIIPSWINTISFLLSISHDPELLDWILRNEPEIAIKFEPDKIETSERIKIFKDVFNYYKKRRIWIDRDKFRYDELGRFGQLDEIINFLISEIKAAKHYTTLSNAIKILSTMRLPHSFKSQARELLMKAALDKFDIEITVQVQQDAMRALCYLKINSKDVVDQIVSELRNSKNDWIRYGLYFFLHSSEYLDEYIDIFLEGIKYTRFEISNANITRSRLGNERTELIEGLKKVKSTEAIKKVISYFIDRETDMNDLFIGKHDVSFLAENASKAYSEDPSLLSHAVNFLLSMLNNHQNEEANQFILFFDNTDTRFLAFQQALGKDTLYKEDLLATLANNRCIEHIIEQYQGENISDDDIWRFLQALRWKNKELFLQFYENINEKFDNKFKLPPERNYEKERKERSQRDFDLLFDKEAVINEIKRIFEIEKKQTFTTKELFKLRSKHYPDLYYSDLATQLLRIIAGNDNVTIEKAVETINKWDWDWFCISKIYEKLMNNKEIKISKEHQNWIKEWCYSNLDNAEFKTAIIKKGEGGYSIRVKAIYLWYFFQRFEITFPKPILLDMLSFDYDRYGVEYLENYLDETEMSLRIIKNLEEGIIVDDVLRNHLDYCKRYGIKEGINFALKEIVNPNRENNDEIRRIALETFFELSDSVAELENLLPDIADDFKWEVLDKLIEHNSKYAHEFLCQLFQTSGEPDRFKAAEYLIKLQDLDALAYYVDRIRKKQNFSRSLFDSSPLPHLRTSEATSLLLELIELSYQERFQQSEHFERLDRLVLNSLTTIALQSDENYSTTRASIERFITKFDNVYKNVNWLYSFLEQLEQKYYVNKGEKINIEEVISKMEKISI